MPTPQRAFLGLGANLGERRATLAAARASLDRLPDVRVCASSALYASTAAEGALGQPPFLNAVVEVATELTPLRLLRECLAIEERFGRVRRERHSARTLDIDLLLFGEERIEAPGLVLPHPRLAERPFVLRPLCDLCPDGTLPGRDASFSELLSLLPADAMPVRVAGDW